MTDNEFFEAFGAIFDTFDFQANAGQFFVDHRKWRVGVEVIFKPVQRELHLGRRFISIRGEWFKFKG